MQELDMSDKAAAVWQSHTYNKISHALKLPSENLEEIRFLKLKADSLRHLRKKLLMEKCD